nr:AMP-binding protein [Sphingomonas sp.]
TEAFRSASLDPREVDLHPDSVGRPIPFASLRIVRADGSEAEPGEEGELVHSGPLVAQGYWNDPERTAQRFRGRELWSGDTMVVGKDGLLRFRARNDAMIKVSGNRISPTDIEEAALASGSVRDAAAFGVPDVRNGHAIVLIVVGDGDEVGLRRYLKHELPAHMQPTRILWREALLTGPNGKLDRTALMAAL